MMWRRLRWCYAALSAVLTAACLWFAHLEWVMWQGIARASIVFLAVVAALFALTSLSVARSWRLGSVMAGLSGTALVLYGLAVVLMGWEDVGGARGAIPLAVGTCLAGGLGILVGIRGKGERGEAA